MKLHYYLKFNVAGIQLPISNKEFIIISLIVTFITGRIVIVMYCVTECSL